jgi:glycosyltransferase involved in cell wall biosynthesis
MILIDALFINKGGGAILLDYLITTINLSPQKHKFFFLIDRRFDISRYQLANFIVLNNSMISRRAFYKKNRNKFSSVLCFANIPPPIRLNSSVYTYFQNQLLLKGSLNLDFSAKKSGTKSLFIKSLLIKLLKKNTDYFIVQTPHMKDEIINSFLITEEKCKVIPFFNVKCENQLSGNNLQDANSFLYISTPAFHKNHFRLLKAWEHLHLTGHDPKLIVTIDDFSPELLQLTNELIAKGVNIVNYGFANPYELYKIASFLIFPSLIESFGLPLIEAAKCGLKVLAPDLPYVSSVIIPGLTFNPFDIISIADAVLTALKNDLPGTKILVNDHIEDLINLLVSNS